MTYILVQFDYPNKGTAYTRLLMAMLASIRKNDPSAKVICKRMKPPQIIRYHWVSSNTKKLEIWCNEIEKCEDENIVLIDCDMMVLKSPEAVFLRSFDVAYTINGTGSIPVNGGVIFVKKNKRSIDFFKQFKIVNDQMVVNQDFHNRYRAKYAGMNQAAFGYLLEHGGYDAKLIPLPCNPYNICKNDWMNVNQNSLIVHVKSDLRRAVLSSLPLAPNYQRYTLLREIWLKFYKASNDIVLPEFDTEYGTTINIDESIKETAVNKQFERNKPVRQLFVTNKKKRKPLNQPQDWLVTQ